MKKLVLLVLAFLPFFSIQGEIKAVVFDFGNVFMRFKEGKSPTIRFISESLGSTPDAVLTELKKSYYASVGSGKQNEEEYWKEFAAHLNVPYPENWLLEWKTFHMNAIEINHELFQEIANLKMRGFQVGLLSNQVSSLPEVYKAEGYYDCFDPLILSCEAKASKPQPQIYHLLIKEIALHPEEILFVDDKEENLEVAQELGIQTIQYDFNKDSMEDLMSQLEFHFLRGEAS